MTQYKMLIDGELRDGVASIDVVNPADESVVAQCPVADEAMLNQAVESAHKAYLSWRKLSFSERGAYIKKLTTAVEENAEAFARILTQEQGKPLAQARDEVMFSQLFANHFAECEIENKVLSDDDNGRIEVLREPLGVVAGICPWNFPLLISLYKIAPAVMAGNSIIIKPAPTTPLSSLKLAELIADIFPPGVVNVLCDNNDLGPAISSHPGIAKVSFTGSTPTGKKIMASAADTLKRLTLELGGNDAAIVLDDVDPKQVAEGIFGAAFLNSGQVCIALKRLYVHESIYDELCEEIGKLASAAVVGNGLDEGVQFGPVQNRMQFDKVCSYIDNAKANGRIIAGGEVPDAPGFVVPLTVVRDIEDGAAVVDEEPFGPILPIVRYRDLEDVIKRANNSDYGLGGSVWSSNLDRAREVAGQIDSGTVWINQHCAFGPHIPFAPAKESGLGVEWGEEGFHEFTAMKVVNISKAYSNPVH
ncbi:aldehyde dehydrogenase family protein [Pseudoteredinibacter isoporae]|uniref:Acyl-CoA reductase-like NAD-dependent aldehyde dehydrogenase n=1 Tax=Pseudoteredinibacter isoporae TaxID=570281 RepID=A0A7X0MWH7_9GAMM|nr:aldehyde dehydrogenase family protein [Pseudoteredinibacter isoporae]MBB6520954.1 acyl-CoA reductase-like NAD-dependent aldehyde dehydrogenase [Pseudoteredinibacter isoporae]NHO86519.1 aldehyde dehydrogenase family protein [Pseudoteredinibacter isoporae]NIB25029.1 aldehyde dehydrogenase family protein [Pseudoteredinibacter isoporae]